MNGIRPAGSFAPQHRSMRLLLFLFPAALSVTAARAQEWTDPDFGTAGVVNTALDPFYDGIYAMVRQPDGKLVITGPAGQTGDLQVLVARYDTDGTLDATFDGDGVNTFDIAGDDYGYAIALQDDGRILIAGTSKNGSNTDILVMRLTADGQPDDSFDADGHLLLDLSPSNDRANAIAVRPDGHILIAGNAQLDGRECMLLAQFAPDGAPDTGFGNTGIVKQLVGTGNSQANALVLLADGRCMVGGSSFTDDATKYDLAACRFLADGTPDPAFSGDGVAVVAVSAENDKGYALAVQDDGAVLIGGVRNEVSSTLATVVLVRLDAAGGPDPAFGTDGVASLFTGGYPTRGEDIALQPDGRILLCGTASPASNQRDAYLCRLNTDGTLDNGFGNSGELRYGAPDHYRETPTLVLQPDGKVVIGGIDAGGGVVNALLIRYFTDLPTGILPTDGPSFPATVAADGITLTLPPAAGPRTAILIDATGRTVGRWAGTDLSASPCTLPFAHRLAAGVHTLLLTDEAGRHSVRFFVPGTGR